MLSDQEVQELQEIVKQNRRDILRMVHHAGSGHPGGSLSAIEALTLLYVKRMRVRPEDPMWRDRDMFFLSKGHCTPAYYTAMASRGYFDREELMTFRDMHTRLQGHPSNLHLPGVDISSGSLGQGLSVCNGAALAAKIDGRDARFYCMIGDGEAQEGQVWEASMTAAQHALDNVCAILDKNDIQLDDKVDTIKSLGDSAEKWRAFGWHVVTVDGHSLRQLDAAFDEAEATKGKPTMIISQTVKGKGVSYMENTAKFHGMAPTDEELKIGLEELR